MNKVLVIGYVWPEPNSSAAGRHMMSILRLFKQQGWQVEFATPAQTTDHMIDLASEGISSQAIELNSDSFDNYVSEYQPDIVLFDRFLMEEQFGWRVEKNCPDAIKILDTEDLQCLRHARQQAHKSHREMTQTDLFNDIAKREIAAILRCDLSLIISPFELTLLLDTFKVDASLLHHLPFMIDLTQLPHKTLSFDERQHFVSIGNFRHAPNWDAVLYLQEIWPQIRKKLPNAELHIYGAYPPPKATALTNTKTGFIVKGWAKNALEVMEKARVCLAPLRFGAGLKGKLLDAMIVATPSVTTSIGSEGMHQNHDWPGIVADDLSHFINASVDLYSDKSAWGKAQRHCYSLLAAQYDNRLLGSKLIAQIHIIKDDLTNHRFANFTGAMLKHHTMNSTKYMSQWIAEKRSGETPDLLGKEPLIKS